MPELRVINGGATPVLILEGDELVGAKQNRVVNTSVLVAAASELVLPVSCVERGRWSYRSRAFSSGDGSPHVSLRRLKSRAEGTHPEGLRGAILGHLEGAFAEAERELGLDRMRAWPARRGPLIELLRRAVEAEGFAVPGAEVAETESWFDGEWCGFRVVGRVNRVDRTPEGLVFVDYKSGSSVASPDLQLALYREAAATALFPGEAVRGAYYYSLKKSERINVKPPDEEEVARVVGEVRANLEAGRLPPDSLERDPSQKVCEWCAFDLVCRKGPRLARKIRDGEGS